MRKSLLLLGGGGYVGTHLTLEAALRGYRVTVLDNFQNSDQRLTARLQSRFPGQINVLQSDGASREWLERFDPVDIDAVVHLIGRKSVPESFRDPSGYILNNVEPTILLFQLLQSAPHIKWVYSSSCTVYAPSEEPLSENSPIGPISPYGESKYLSERVLLNFTDDLKNRGVVLRYFNPIGARPEEKIGEFSTSSPRMVVETIFHAAKHGLSFRINGACFKTRDGTPERDYIDVSDLAKAHLCVVEDLLMERVLPNVINLGVGSGITVLELCKIVEAATGLKIDIEYGPARVGDAPKAIASTALASSALSWSPTRSIDESISDAWDWANRAGTLR